jgi:two-component system phosphate regulon response regulator OmpR
MSDRYEVIVVDDEREIREMVGDYLKENGFAVRTANGGTRLRALVDEKVPDLVLLDIRMPGEDGLTLARFLREHTDAAIVMVTAAGDVTERIVGLEMGADDYIPKPFNLRELLARIKAVLRRAGKTAGADDAKKAASGTEVRMGACVLRIDSRRLIHDDGSELALTSMEFDLLEAFAGNPNRVLSRDQLLDLAHNRDWEPFDRSIDIRISRIRRKVEQDPRNPRFIKTVRGVGYMFVPGGGE